MLGRLTGWTRVGIVLSVIWALTILAWALHDLGAASRLIDGLFAKCVATPKGNVESCELMAQSLRASAYMNITSQVLWLGLVLIVAAWVLASAVIASVRWIRRGFEPRCKG